jgi:hypothetical protein
MSKRNFLLADPARPEGPDNAHTRAKIDDAILALMAEGDRLNHDLVAKRAGVGIVRIRRRCARRPGRASAPPAAYRRPSTNSSAASLRASPISTTRQTR